MQYRKLGKTDVEVSHLAFGAWQLGDPAYWGTDTQADAQAAVDAAIDGGINFFDTAEMYGDGESERVLGKVLGKRRNNLILATKAWPTNCAPKDLRAACEASLERLGTDYVDLYQIHWPFSHASYEEAQAELDKLKAEGKIRMAGVSNFGTRDLASWLETGQAVTNQLGHNLLFRAVEYDIVPACRRQGVGVIAYMPLLQGLLAGKWDSIEDIPPNRRRTRHFSGTRENVKHGEPGCEDLLMQTLNHLSQFADAIDVPLATVSICWLAAQPGVDSVIVGARDAAQVRRNLQAAAIDIGPAAIAQLNEITGPLKNHLGDNADMWLSEAESRIH